MPDIVIVHDVSGDGQALYIDGKLKAAHHSVEEDVYDALGVAQWYDAPLFPGGAWGEAPTTLAALNQRVNEINEKAARAEELRERARKLMREADELEG